MAEATGLKHIQDNQIHESALQSFCNSLTIGPVKIDYCLDPSIPQLTFQVYLMGVQIGSGTINPQNPCVTVGGSVSGFKAEVTLCIDPSQKQATYEIEVCAPIVGCKKWTGILFSWP